MMKNNLNLLTFEDGAIEGGFVLRTENAPENGNMALHVCLHPQDVMDSRRLLADLTLPLENWVLASQKHTDHVVRVFQNMGGTGAFDADTAIENTDGLYTTDPDVLIGVFTADCLGILLYDPDHPVAAAVHSGWKGTAKGILFEMLKTLKEEGLLYPQSLHVRFSPSLLYSSLEVGPEVIEQIEDMARRLQLDLSGCIRKGEGDRFFLDNQGANVKMLEAFGIPEKNIVLSDLDTKTRPDCFSYRRDGRFGGEHFSWIFIRQEMLKR